MNDLSTEKTMTVKEVAEVLGVTPEAIKKHVRNLFPHLIENGKKTYLNEYHVTAIKSRMTPTTKVAGAKTDLDKALIVAQAMRIMDEQIEVLQKELTEAKPKIAFYNQVTGSKDTIDMKDAAKTLNLGIGRNKLFAFLREQGILDSRNQPYQTYIDRGFFRVVESSYTLSDGSVKINLKTVVFQRGLDFIRKLYIDCVSGR